MGLMNVVSVIKPEPLQAIATAIAQERSLEVVLNTIVRELGECWTVALARIWLIEPGDICAVCPMRGECPDQSKCLHLAASGGRSRDESQELSNSGGSFQRFPLGAQIVGRIATTGEALLLGDLSLDDRWIADKTWIEREGVVSFAGQPLIYRGEALGVIEVFSRLKLGEEEFRWLRVFADQAAIAIANAGAFEEINRLREQLEMENAYLREEVNQELAFGEIIGHSPALNRVLTHIHTVAPTNATVLIQGESGTGKELIARAIHERSARRARPLIKVNCASIPRELFESEFFGHVKGSFTGAVRDRAGRFQLADGATLFLDEVGEIPLELQSKLLRVLQEREYERVGDGRTHRVDARLIAATNRDLNREVSAGRFRQDLYYRLAVFPIEVPPLRERRSDIPSLADHFVNFACRRLKIPKPRFAPSQLQLLQNYDWPGNIRELQNVIERSVILARGGALRFDDWLSAASAKKMIPSMIETAPADVLTVAEIRRRDRANILAALERTGGKIYGPGGAAELLGMKGTTLATRIKALKIKKDEYLRPLDES
ncbi:MAG TPA: sigma 54-interacting transcriptional regulator [Blastocatellia bacterium]